jgi:NAD(P)-dependent dehydrogenase (short-subunit alcohol dehydrogenase family)
MASPTVLITGALAGIGRETALAFARDGFRLVVSGRRADAGRMLEDELRALGAEAFFVDAAVARFGRLDAAVNNAGTEGTTAPLTEVTVEAYAETFDTNVLGVVFSLKHELRLMEAQGTGSIINLSSTMGHRGAPGLALYTASKHAVEGLTRAAALEAAPFGVRVNAIAPGPVDTDMLTRITGSAERMAAFVAGVPLKRAGRPHEIADAIVFLASNRASFLTGQIIDVNGGKTAA